MKIHSDKITGADIFEAVPERCYLAYQERPNGKTGIIIYEGSRSHARGFHVRLSGSSKYRMNGSAEDRSATWDEWGIFIARLFEIDPHAKIGHYTGRNNFIDVTQSEHERISQYRTDLLPTHSAPWLYQEV